MPQNDAANRKATSSADLENSFAFVEGMRIAPISRNLLCKSLPKQPFRWFR